MPSKAFVIRPQFGEANKPGIKWIFSYIVGNAPIVSVGHLDQGSQVGTNLWDLFRWESKNSEDSYGRLHRNISIEFGCMEIVL
ncbi:MAG: hypothetical protein FD135_4888 [Comamonadaceae bacterium]|nr:MAG: hypothetical protein FD135_4888 [Comamonadaceae bacterium]